MSEPGQRAGGYATEHVGHLQRALHLQCLDNRAKQGGGEALLVGEPTMHRRAAQILRADQRAEFCAAVDEFDVAGQGSAVVLQTPQVKWRRVRWHAPHRLPFGRQRGDARATAARVRCAPGCCKLSRHGSGAHEGVLPGPEGRRIAQDLMGCRGGKLTPRVEVRCLCVGMRRHGHLRAGVHGSSAPLRCSGLAASEFGKAHIDPDRDAKGRRLGRIGLPESQRRRCAG